MGNKYNQLNMSERIEIYHLSANGMSLRGIATRLGRAASTVSRELERNSKVTKQWDGGYDAIRAEGLAQRRRRWDCRFKLERQPELRDLVRNLLAMGWSPEQIAGRLALDNGYTVISHESIYRYAYHRSTAHKDYWHKYFARKKFYRGKRGKQGGSPILYMKNRVSISERPDEINLRQRFGDWEADLMLFAKYGQALLVTHERNSRVLIAHRQASKSTQGIFDVLSAQMLCLPPELRQSMTFDNGTEFFHHYRLNAHPFNMATYFCDIRSPWQKGGVENAIGRLRRKLPRKTDLDTLSQEEIDNFIQNYNSTPRKCLGYRTPAEVFSEKLKVLHFKREFIFLPSQE